MKKLFEPNEDTAYDENELSKKKELRREGAASRTLHTIEFPAQKCSSIKKVLAQAV